MLSFALALALSVAANANKPVVQNAGFEASPSLLGWKTKVDVIQENGRTPTFTVDRNDAKEGNQSLVIEALSSAHALVSQKIFLPVGSLWRVKAWAKTEGLSAADQSRAGEAFRDPPPTGGFITVETLTGDIGTSAGGLGTTPWHEEEATFRVPSPGFINLTLVGTSRGTGKVWFDDVRLEALPAVAREDVRIFAEHTTKRPIDAMQQGQFIEILCNLIPSIIAQQVVSTSFEEAPPCKFMYKKEIDEPYRPWYPDGAVEVAQYSLDTTNPFNGIRSQRIELPVEHARAGISQDGFYLKDGISYKLRLHMRSEGNVRVWASLHGGGVVVAGPVSLGQAGENWGPTEGELRATRTTDNATLTIDFEGPGTLWLDRVSLIGSDAVLGIWRPDVVAALKAMHPGNIRFGGSTVENYEWQGGIGPRDQRQPFTTVWGGLEENFVGYDEFIQLCEHVAAEPLICVRWKNKKPEDAAAEVEYCNGSVDTRWGKLRAKNGHPEPYRVKYWQIGNEVDDPAYAATVRAFAEAMKRVDPTIKLVSSFPTKNLLEAAGNAFDYLAPHHYEVGDLAGEDRNFRELQTWIARNGAGRDIRVAVTEWNTTAGDPGLPRGILQTLGNALSVSRYLNLLQRHADLVDIAHRSNFADSFGSGFVLTGPGWIYESPAFYAQELYARAAGSYPVRVDRASQLAWQFREPDLSATLSPDGKTLRIYAVNSTLEAVSTTIHLDGFQASVRGGTVHTLEDREHVMTSEVMNSRDDRERISLRTRQAEISGSQVDFSFQPLTVTLLELTLGK
jgi:alpha-N-arabinofuranosidase